MLAFTKYRTASQNILCTVTASTVWCRLEAPCQRCGSFCTIWGQETRRWEPQIITTDTWASAHCSIFHSHRASGNPGPLPVLCSSYLVITSVHQNPSDCVLVYRDVFVLLPTRWCGGGGWHVPPPKSQLLNFKNFMSWLF